ncbi:MAG: motility protein A [Vallitaleaceae bacterium]|nr:motility protein A [Vallitaleaceae bacterium]
MELSTILGIIVGFGMLILGDILEHGNPAELLLLPPAMIVFGGTLGALMVSYTMNDIKRIPEFFKEAFTASNSTKDELITFFVKLSQLARSEGLLSLEGALESGEYGKNIDPLIVKGIKLVVDGTQPELVKDVLETEVYVLGEHRKIGVSIFEGAGGFSPTMGIVGTVMGLIKILGNLDDAEALAPAIASAFIATLYGVLFANLIFLPMASKLKGKAKREKMEKEFMIEGIMSIQAGENPTVLKEKLMSFLVPGEKAKVLAKESANTEERA